MVTIRTSLKAGCLNYNHNETVVTVWTGLKAGGGNLQHNETVVAVTGRRESRRRRVGSVLTAIWSI